MKKNIIPRKWSDHFPKKYKQSQDSLLFCGSCYVKYEDSLKPLASKLQKYIKTTDFWGLIIECRWHFVNTMLHKNFRNLPSCWSVYLYDEEPNGT